MEAPMARSAARFSISTLALVALAACAAQPTTPAPAPAPPPIIAAPVNPDQDFLNRAVTGTAAQVELGRLAQRQGAAPAVRAFGSQIAAEHARMNARLTALSQRLGMVPNPVAPDLSGMAALSGPEFDRQFIADQVKNQREALGLYESEAQAGQNPRLRSVARESLPMLRRDLRRTEELAARLGA
jgi:putative membrane protein